MERSFRRPLSDVVPAPRLYRSARLPSYKRAKLATMMKTRRYIQEKDQLQVEVDRCEADPIYCIQWCPYTLIEQIDYDDPTEPVTGHVCMIDLILSGCIEIVQHKYGTALLESRMIRESHAFLQSKNATHHDKLFFIYFVLKKEATACELIRDLFVVDHEGNLWGDDVYEHFNTFMLHIDACVEKTIRFPCSEANIQDVIYNFVFSSKTEYLLK
jgi:hypothetical protein